MEKTNVEGDHPPQEDGYESSEVDELGSSDSLVFYSVSYETSEQTTSSENSHISELGTTSSENCFGETESPSDDTSLPTTSELTTSEENNPDPTTIQSNLTQPQTSSSEEWASTETYGFKSLIGTRFLLSEENGELIEVDEELRKQLMLKHKKIQASETEGDKKTDEPDQLKGRSDQRKRKATNAEKAQGERSGESVKENDTEKEELKENETDKEKENVNDNESSKEAQVADDSPTSTNLANGRGNNGTRGSKGSRFCTARRKVYLRRYYEKSKEIRKRNSTSSSRSDSRSGEYYRRPPLVYSSSYLPKKSPGRPYYEYRSRNQQEKKSRYDEMKKRRLNSPFYKDGSGSGGPHEDELATPGPSRPRQERASKPVPLIQLSDDSD